MSLSSKISHPAFKATNAVVVARHAKIAGICRRVKLTATTLFLGARAPTRRQCRPCCKHVVVQVEGRKRARQMPDSIQLCGLKSFLGGRPVCQKPSRRRFACKSALRTAAARAVPLCVRARVFGECLQWQHQTIIWVPLGALTLHRILATLALWALTHAAFGLRLQVFTRLVPWCNNFCAR